MKHLWNTDFIYNNNLDKVCFQHDMAYDKYKNLNERRHLDKVVGDKAFEVASNSKCGGYQKGLASLV